MPDFAIIDSHVHLVDLSLPYGWTRILPASLRVERSPADLRRDLGGVVLDRVMTVEFLVDQGHHLAEAKAAACLAQNDPLIGGFVANAPVERGRRVAEELAALQQFGIVRAIRRIIEADRFEAALDVDFVDGVRCVGEFGLPFEIGVDHQGLPVALELVRRCPDVTFVLDHLGTPPIAPRPQALWRQLMQGFAAQPNVVAKLSGLMAGTKPGWTAESVVGYLRTAVECFGTKRVMFGSDWPMHTVTLPYASWVGIVDHALAGVTTPELHAIYHHVAVQTYNLEAGRGEQSH